MKIKNRKALTLVESLISIMILSIFVIGLLATFVISRVGTARSEHRMVAMGLARKYIEQEIRGGYNGGSYITPLNLTDGSIVNTEPAINGTSYTIKAKPYPAVHAPIDSDASTVNYRTAGFEVTWNESMFGSGTTITCSERIATYISDAH